MKPFIHIFKTPGNHCYLYDVNTDAICQITEQEYSLLCNQQKSCEELCEAGLLSKKRISDIKHPFITHIDELLNSKLNVLILQVTQKCNLRCKYCVYSGKYENIRTHSQLDMSLDMAEKSIKFFLERTKDSLNPTIGFYGGEPLLKFDLIKKVVQYVKVNYPCKLIRYTITTNATLLDLEKFEFLIKNGFSIMISIDGPQKVHDKNRLFMNEKGSYDIVISNLKNIAIKYPEEYKKIIYSSVIDHSCPYSEISDFFMKNKYFCNKHGHISEIFGGYDNSLEKNSYYNENINQEKFELFKYYLSILEKYNPEKVLSSILRNDRLEKFFNRKPQRGELPSVYAHHGTCIPGVSKLFINVNGEFFVCEKASENSNVLNIGNINIGFDKDKIISLLNCVNLVEEDCKNCWAVRYCSICALLVDDNDKLSPQKNRRYCNAVKNDTKRKLLDYCIIQELKRRG